jgi:hypothetical protein
MKLHNQVRGVISLAFGLFGCGQIGNHAHKETINMKTDVIENPFARQAIDAWQAADSQKWMSMFTNDAKLYDDGKARDLHSFSTEAIGHEYFTAIDKVEENGACIYGKFHSDTWGDFKTYFRFHTDKSGKIYRLDIGQADY